MITEEARAFLPLCSQVFFFSAAMQSVFNITNSLVLIACQFVYNVPLNLVPFEVDHSFRLNA